MDILPLTITITTPSSSLYLAALSTCSFRSLFSLSRKAARRAIWFSFSLRASLLLLEGVVGISMVIIIVLIVIISFINIIVISTITIIITINITIIIIVLVVTSKINSTTILVLMTRTYLVACLFLFLFSQYLSSFASSGTAIFFLFLAQGTRVKVRNYQEWSR